jgi:hypothetical protein
MDNGEEAILLVVEAHGANSDDCRSSTGKVEISGRCRFGSGRAGSRGMPLHGEALLALMPPIPMAASQGGQLTPAIQSRR